MTFKQWLSGIDWAEQGPVVVGFLLLTVPLVNSEYQFVNPNLLAGLIAAFMNAHFYIATRKSKVEEPKP